MIVRPFDLGDAPRLATILRRAIQGIGSCAYSPEQCAAWIGRAPDAARLARLYSDGRLALVAADEEVPLAFGDVEADGHIQFFYRAPEAPREATGRLYAALEAAARRRNIPRLSVEASEPARRFFGRQGFATLHRRELEIDGTSIHNYAMEKRLDG